MADVNVVEVGPRDGLQSEKIFVETDVKRLLIERLSACGLTEVETTSFVSPKAVPQFSDANDLMLAMQAASDVRYRVLTPNIRGYEAAVNAGVRHIAVFTAASETFNERNIGCSIAQAQSRIDEIVVRANEDGVSLRAYVSTVFGCPFEGPISPQAVAEVLKPLASAGITNFSLGDTIGVAVPREVADVIAAATEVIPVDQIALHMHDTRGTAIANVFEGIRHGITTFDSSVGGLGGCPFAPGASGNLATEDLVWALEREGYKTGIDLAQLIEVAKWITHAVGKVPAGHVANARVWPYSAQD